MSTHPEFQRADDELLALLTSWQQGRIGNDELRRGIEGVGSDNLAPGQRVGVQEVLAELATAAPGDRDRLEPVVRSAIEALYYGD